MSETIEAHHNAADTLRAGPAYFIARLVNKRYAVISNVHAKQGTVIYNAQPGRPQQATYEMRTPDGETFAGSVTAVTTNTAIFADTRGEQTGSMEMVDSGGSTVSWRSTNGKQFGQLVR